MCLYHDSSIPLHTHTHTHTNAHTHTHTHTHQGRNNNITIDTLCAIMTNESLGTALQRYIAIKTLMYGNESLDVSFQGEVEFMKNTSWNSSAAFGGKDHHVTIM